MEVTLKRAADLARAALDAANGLNLEPKASISIHAPDPTAAAQRATRAFDEALEKFEGLLAAHYAIRALIGAANSTSGLDDLLTRRARLEAVEKRLAATVEKAGRAQDAPEALAIFLSDIAMSKQRAAAGHGVFGTETVSLPLMDHTRHGRIAETRAALRRERADIADAVAAINLNTSVALDPVTAATLKEAKITV